MKAKELLPLVRRWAPAHLWEVQHEGVGRPAVCCVDCALTVVAGAKNGPRYSFKEDGRVESPIAIATHGDIKRLRVPQRDCDLLEHEL